MFDEYKDPIKSDVVDMKNSGGRQAGSKTGALLLAEFVGGATWILPVRQRQTGYRVTCLRVPLECLLEP